MTWAVSWEEITNFWRMTQDGLRYTSNCQLKLKPWSALTRISHKHFSITNKSTSIHKSSHAFSIVSTVICWVAILRSSPIWILIELQWFFSSYSHMSRLATKLTNCQRVWPDTKWYGGLWKSIKNTRLSGHRRFCLDTSKICANIVLKGGFCMNWRKISFQLSRHWRQ